MFGKFIKVVNENGVISSIIATILCSFFVYIFSPNGKLFSYEILINKKLIDKSICNTFDIYCLDSSKLYESINVVQVDLWNRGNLPIENRDFKIPFSICLDSNATILKNIYIKEKYPTLSKTKYHIDKHRLELEFEYLDNKNGVQLIFYYTNPNISKIKFEGFISQSDALIKNVKTIKYIYFPLVLIFIFFITIFSASFIYDFISKYIGKYRVLMEKSTSIFARHNFIEFLISMSFATSLIIGFYISYTVFNLVIKDLLPHSPLSY